MIICSAPLRMPGAISAGMLPLCCLAYGKMAYSSCNRSRSVRTTPFTRATGFPETRGADVAETGLATAVGACEATWAFAADRESRSTAQMGSWYFIVSFLLLQTCQELGRGWIPPRSEEHT